MLVDLTPKNFIRDEYSQLSDEEFADAKHLFTPHRIGLGLYATRTWNPEICFEDRFKEDDIAGRHLTAYERQLPICDQDTIRQQILRDVIDNDRRERKAMRRLYSQRYKRNWEGEPGGYGSGYGVCDYPEQVLERYPHYADDDVPRALTFVEVRREHEPASGGWRYHKWGTYIGKQRPVHEYLYHDTHIDPVWTFSVHKVDQAAVRSANA